MGRKSREDIQKIFTIENVTQNERPVENFESYSSISNKEYNLKNEIDILISLYYNPLYNLEIEDRAKTSNFDDCVFVNHNNDSELEALKSPNRNKQNELEYVKTTTIQQMWHSELDKLLEQYLEYKEDRERSNNCMTKKSRVGKVLKKSKSSSLNIVD